ncbi:MAG TPA: thioredoxin domain-containing protein [Rhizomicrobium sp.]|jgi:thiol-disulfide isomerase/thioredoxin|nr:thioredoxin domain-containing protein [Rhizomicrobium sp.]
MRRKLMAVAAIAAALAAGAAAPPPLPITDLKNLPVVTTHPYDESANANAVVADAFARAKKSHKLVMLDLGGNWCPDCVILANVMRLPAMKTFMAAHYEFAAVDVGQFDKNLQIPARFGFTKRLEGVPTVLVVTPEGKLVNGGHVFALSDARNMTPQSLAAYLAEWVK